MRREPYVSGGRDAKRWENLVVETQIATELVISGIRKICELPMDRQHPFEIGYSEIYPLNVGLHMYTTGLERLCKLAIACHAFLETGQFARVKKASHNLSDLLKSLEELDLSGYNFRNETDAARPVDEYGEELIAWLERFAQGGGRYEILNSLSNPDTEVLTWEEWQRLCDKGVVSEGVKESISLRYAIGHAIEQVIYKNDLESSAQDFLEESTRRLSEGAAAVGMAMFRRARWAAHILAELTHYQHQQLPILNEVLYVLRNDSDAFFAYEIARISDPQTVEEELGAYFDKNPWDEDWDDDDDADGDDTPVEPQPQTT